MLQCVSIYFLEYYCTENCVLYVRRENRLLLLCYCPGGPRQYFVAAAEETAITSKMYARLNIVNARVAGKRFLMIRLCRRHYRFRKRFRIIITLPTRISSFCSFQIQENVLIQWTALSVEKESTSLHCPIWNSDGILLFIMPTGSANLFLHANPRVIFEKCPPYRVISNVQLVL